MPCQILVAYLCATKGEIVAVLPGDHVFGALETLAAHGDRDTWNRHFTVVRVTDKSKSELAHLVRRLPIAGGVEPIPGTTGRYWFDSPAPSDPEYSPLNDTGEIECAWSTAAAFLRERT